MPARLGLTVIQLWAVDEMKNSVCHHDIALRYCLKGTFPTQNAAQNIEYFPVQEFMPDTGAILHGHVLLNIYSSVQRSVVCSIGCSIDIFLLFLKI